MLLNANNPLGTCSVHSTQKMSKCCWLVWLPLSLRLNKGEREGLSLSFSLSLPLPSIKLNKGEREREGMDIWNGRRIAPISTQLDQIDMILDYLSYCTSTFYYALPHHHSSLPFLFLSFLFFSSLDEIAIANAIAIAFLSSGHHKKLTPSPCI